MIMRISADVGRLEGKIPTEEIIEEEMSMEEIDKDVTCLKLEAYGKINAAYKIFKAEIEEGMNKGRYQSLALTAAENALLWATADIMPM